MKFEDLDFNTIEIVEPKKIKLNKECEIELYKDIKKNIPHLRTFGKISKIEEKKILDALNKAINS